MLCNFKGVIAELPELNAEYIKFENQVQELLEEYSTKIEEMVYKKLKSAKTSRYIKVILNETLSQWDKYDELSQEIQSNFEGILSTKSNNLKEANQKFREAVR